MEIKLDKSTLGGKSMMIATPMYGGNCHGMYAKACIDLAMLLGMQGVPHRFYYIFNESLITRARNYLVDEFLRSKDNDGKPATDSVSGKPIEVKTGKFGPYVTDGTTNASLQLGDSVEQMNGERAKELLAERRAQQ